MPASETDAGTRKRFARRQWARRWMSWRPILALVLAVALIGSGIWLVFFSTVLAVEKVKVTGESFLSESQVQGAAEVPLGEPLARVDLAAIEDRVASMAAVRKVEVRRTWPDSVTIEVDERQAIAVAKVGDRVEAMDSEGVFFRRFRTPPGDLPLVVLPADADSDVRVEAGRVVDALPQPVDSQIERIDVSTVDQITLRLTDGKTVLWGSAEDSATKGEVLAALIRQPGRTYDVSVPGQPTVRG